MPKASCRSRLAPAALVFAAPLLVGAAVLGGCASAPPQIETAYYQPVSAREYGYVRPAVDVRVVGRGGERGTSSQADLWERVRHGRGLNIESHPRVDTAARSMARNPNYLTGLSQRARPYLHLIVSELERAGLPAELALLPEVESRYNPRAISPASACGMWQFMPYTGREMGLAQNGLYDGRNDVVASTRGAIAYLKQLNAEFSGDWALTLAAYNAGPARVRGAQNANAARGRSTDYWSLNLPNETQQYVPKLLAVAALVREPARYGLVLPKIDNRPGLELVEARAQIDLGRAAIASGLSMQTLRDLNPGLKQGKTPPAGPHQVLVPVGAGDRLRSALAKQGIAMVAKPNEGPKKRASKERRNDPWSS